ncbi:hypothetical protein Dsin_009659 [Dipteronia sinensis]|uniref:Myb/SANT-like domain-containing protein n=1 Tax=Dipteronia sinensis TaxID=43782 RepID=A0AAE0AS68_9ROSI|nr:hypothetical protein Dsin_009659 [Dipteronia sinensis]
MKLEVVNFNKATGREYTKLQLKNKWDVFKNGWTVWKQLIGKEIGLGWNTNLKTIDAPNEWWLRKLEVYPNVAKFCKEGTDAEMKGKFYRMFMNTTTMGDTGDHAWTPSSNALPSDGCELNNNDTIVLDNDLVDEDAVKVTHES